MRCNKIPKKKKCILPSLLCIAVHCTFNEVSMYFSDGLQYLIKTSNLKFFFKREATQASSAGSRLLSKATRLNSEYS